MVKDSDIVTINISRYEMSFVFRMAERSAVGGHSSVRDPDDRKENLGVDQFTGQAAQYAGTKWLTGSSQPYMVQRWYANMHPRRGDGGSDIPGANIDFKGSRRKKRKIPLLSYRLLLRPNEIHRDWVYIFALVENPGPESCLVHLIGWATDAMLPERPEAKGPFRGAHTIPARQLNPLPPIKWFFDP